tara:strand:- start:2119 stop:2391 length:273 start_codon:yes stop_codon:yes gene_type:complete
MLFYIDFNKNNNKYKQEDLSISTMRNYMKTTLMIKNKHYSLKYERKMPEKEILKMKSFVTQKGDKIIKTDQFKINKIIEKDKERIFEVNI